MDEIDEGIDEVVFDAVQFMRTRHPDTARALIALIRKHVAAAVEAEREACAAMADWFQFAKSLDWWQSTPKRGVSEHTCHEIAAAIRQRGEGKE